MVKKRGRNSRTTAKRAAYSIIATVVFVLRASASAVAPLSPMWLLLRLKKESRGVMVKKRQKQQDDSNESNILDFCNSSIRFKGFR